MKKNIIFISVAFFLFLACFIFLIPFYMGSPIVGYVHLKNGTATTIKVSSADKIFGKYAGKANEQFVIAPGREKKFLHAVGDLVVTDEKGRVLRYAAVDLASLPGEMMTGGNVLVFNKNVFEAQRVAKFLLNEDMMLYVLSPKSKALNNKGQPEGYPKKPQ